MQHFSSFSLAGHGLSGHRGSHRQWCAAAPKKQYDVVIIGGGGHGFATAHYLAANHGICNVAVIERGWIGGGNNGRNTAVIRSNYFYTPSAAFYGRSLDLYRTLGIEEVLGDQTNQCLDLSSAFLTVDVTGTDAAILLEQGMALPLFTISTSRGARTLCGHLPILIKATDDGFRICVDTSLAYAFWRWADHAMAKS